MSSWKVEVSRSGNSAIVELIDTVGPYNEWRCVTAGALVPDQGQFTNQFGDVLPTVQPSWKLLGFDIDAVAVGQQGNGEMSDSGGAFPNGAIVWTVLAEL